MGQVTCQPSRDIATSLVGVLPLKHFRRNTIEVGHRLQYLAGLQPSEPSCFGNLLLIRPLSLDQTPYPLDKLLAPENPALLGAIERIAGLFLPTRFHKSAIGPRRLAPTARLALPGRQDFLVAHPLHTLTEIMVAGVARPGPVFGMFDQRSPRRMGFRCT